MRAALFGGKSERISWTAASTRFARFSSEMWGRVRASADPIQTNTNLGYYTNFVNLLDLAGVAVDKRGYIVVDDELRTNVEGVYALGDCNGRGAFTHTAYNDYEIAAAIMQVKPPVEIGDDEAGPASVETKAQVMQFLTGGR